MRIALFIILLNPFLCFSQEEVKDSSAINRVVEKINRLSENKSKLFTTKKTINRDTFIENWMYYEDKQFSRIAIDYRIDSIAYSEKYYFKNRSLIYAYESETMYSPFLGQNDYSHWAGDFYFTNEKLVDHVTLGHGKSELDDWDPEKEILNRLKKRKVELRSLK